MTGFRRSQARYVKKSHRNTNWPESAAGLGDASRVPALLRQIDSPLASLRADGAYEKEPVYGTIENHRCDRSPKVLIPPKTNAQVKLEVAVLRERNRSTRSRARLGKRQWHTKSGSSKRSMAEHAVCRYQAIVGRTRCSRTLQGQRVEAEVKCRILNTMTALGMPAEPSGGPNLNRSWGVLRPQPSFSPGHHTAETTSLWNRKS